MHKFHLRGSRRCGERRREQLQNEYRDERNLFVQRLRDRKENGGDVVLYYSNSGGGVEGNWVVRRSGDGWRVVGFNKLW